jgi:ribosomal-protein-alanine N-acetyltransferase
MITYREANAFDLPVFVSLDKQLFPYSPWSASQYKEEFSSPTRHFVVAVDQAQSIVGYAGVFAPGAAEADILTVGVVPDHRGKGIAKALMALITEWAKAQGTTAMMLEVKVDNSEAIGLYESLGYSKLNVRKDYFGAG